MEKGLVHIFLLIVIVLVGIAGVGYFAYKNGQISSSQDNILSPTPTQNPTGNWETYTNTDYNFSFRYPDNWNINSFDKDNVKVSIWGANNNQPGPHDMAQLMVNVSALDGSLSEVVRSEYKSSTESSGDIVNYQDIQEIETSGGLTGYRFYCFFLTYQDCIYLQLNTDMYLKILSSYADDENRNYKDTLEQILSTFKFVDGNSDVAISASEINQGFYLSKFEGKKAGTPESWVFEDSDETSCWHKPEVSCTN